MSLDEAFVDMTGFESLYGSLNNVAREMKGRVRSDLKITASVGMASSKVAAKVASELEKPDGPGGGARWLGRSLSCADARWGSSRSGCEDCEAS